MTTTLREASAAFYAERTRQYDAFKALSEETKREMGWTHPANFPTETALLTFIKLHWEKFPIVVRDILAHKVGHDHRKNFGPTSEAIEQANDWIEARQVSDATREGADLQLVERLLHELTEQHHELLTLRIWGESNKAEFNELMDLRLWKLAREAEDERNRAEPSA